MPEKMRFAFLQEPPFCFIDGSGRLGGSDAQLAKRVCLTLGLELLPIETEFAELLPGFAEDRWDITTGLFFPTTAGSWSTSQGRSGCWQMDCWSRKTIPAPSMAIGPSPMIGRR